MKLSNTWTVPDTDSVDLYLAYSADHLIPIQRQQFHDNYRKKFSPPYLLEEIDRAWLEDRKRKDSSLLLNLDGTANAEPNLAGNAIHLSSEAWVCDLEKEFSELDKALAELVEIDLWIKDLPAIEDMS